MSARQPDRASSTDGFARGLRSESAASATTRAVICYPRARVYQVEVGITLNRSHAQERPQRHRAWFTEGARLGLVAKRGPRDGRDDSAAQIFLCQAPQPVGLRFQCATLELFDLEQRRQFGV